MNKLIVGNWKMNGNLPMVDEFAQNLDARVILGIPSVFIAYAHLKNPTLQIAAQDCSIYSNFGAHTGEISAKMLSELGCQYVIVGHSERRQTSNFDTQDNICAKLQNITECGMKAILCVDEKYPELVDNQTKAFLKANLSRVCIAYEPLSAIGTGKVPSLTDISETLAKIKDAYFGVQTLYGGSVNLSNAKEILDIELVDGVLIGGASLKLNELNEISRLL